MFVVTACCLLFVVFVVVSLCWFVSVSLFMQAPQNRMSEAHQTGQHKKQQANDHGQLSSLYVCVCLVDCLFVYLFIRLFVCLFVVVVCVGAGVVDVLVAVVDVLVAVVACCVFLVNVGGLLVVVVVVAFVGGGGVAAADVVVVPFVPCRG